MNPEPPASSARRVPSRASRLSAWSLVGCLGVAAVPAHGQQAYEEQPDPTRLDVERLPPEAIEVTRDMFEQGLYVEGRLGGRGFVGGVGRLLEPGFMAGVHVGYEFASWVMLAAALELSMHRSSAPPPPSPTTLEVIVLLAELKLQLPLSARAALFLSAEGGVDWTSGNYLATYGVEGAGDPDLMYGGALGFDWHLLSRHHSLGVLVGARRYQNLRGLDGEQTLGTQAQAYLKYVF